MVGYAFVGALVALNLWMSSRIWRAPSSQLRHKGLLIASIWLMPVLGAVMARSHLHHYVFGEAFRRKARRAEDHASTELAPQSLSVECAPAFELSSALHREQGFVHVDREAARNWLSAIGDLTTRAHAIEALGHAWLLHLRDALGSSYWLHRSPGALLLSGLDPSVVEANAAVIQAARQRVRRWLGPLANPAQARTLVVVFGEPQSYARHLVASRVAKRLQEKSEGVGIFIDDACPHLASENMDLRPLEATLVRESALQAISHMEIPTWLGHGIAEIAKRELVDSGSRVWISLDLLASFWDDIEIQSFWSGEVFLREDESMELACELARVLVENLAPSRAAIVQFASAASRDDAGAGAARDLFGVDLGAYAAALLGIEPRVSWSPRGANVV